MRWPVVILGAWASLASSWAHAQTDFSATTLSKGHVVRVTEPSGLWLQGVVTDVTPSSLSVSGRVFQPQAGLKVERLGDSIWEGAGIGFALGALLGGSVGRTGCFSKKTVGCVVKPGIVFGVIGGLLDRAIVGRRTVFLGKPAGSTALIIQGSSRAPALLVRFSF